MSSRWLIAADDLTGAADCAIAFTKAGTRAAVIWGGAVSSAPVISINIESRALEAEQAAKAHMDTLNRLWSRGTRLYKKIDSTIRGQPAAELAATIDFLKRNGAGALAIMTPAFPGTGRTTEGGSIRVQGGKLEDTPLWQWDHTYETAHLPSVLKSAGLECATIDLATLHRGAVHVRAEVERILEGGYAAIICDAVTEEDLDIIAAATLPLEKSLFWVGSGGLASALARLDGGVDAAAQPVIAKRDGGILVAVGSLSDASRLSARHLAADGTVTHILIDPAHILADDKTALHQTCAKIITALAAGDDVLAEIALTEMPDLSLGIHLMGNLATALEPAAKNIGGIIATGGDTAAALLEHFGVNGLELIGEVESGIPLGLSLGAIEVPVITKAGAFGSETTLLRCLEQIRAMRQQ